MTKAEIIERVAKETGTTQKLSGEVLSALFGIVSDELMRLRRVVWPHFGTWDVKKRKPRRIRGFQSGEIEQLPATLHIGFRRSIKLARRLRLRTKRAA